MKVLKTERCTWLLTNTLDDLIEINLEGPTPEHFSAGDAVQLWYQDRTRPNQSANTLDDLIEINLEGPTPEHFSAGDAVQLWYQDRTRPNQSARKECCPRPGSEREESSAYSISAENEFSLDDWDKLFTKL